MYLVERIRSQLAWVQKKQEEVEAQFTAAHTAYMQAISGGTNADKEQHRLTWEQALRTREYLAGQVDALNMVLLGQEQEAHG
jgi:hypothetical protein